MHFSNNINSIIEPSISIIDWLKSHSNNSNINFDLPEALSSCISYFDLPEITFKSFPMILHKGHTLLHNFSWEFRTSRHCVIIACTLLPSLLRTSLIIIHQNLKTQLSWKIRTNFVFDR